MSGRYEKEKQFEDRIVERLKSAPSIITDYYYYLAGAGRSPMTSYNYLINIMTFAEFVYNDI
jgi:hypothetical protein